jgi:predicted permease
MNLRRQWARLKNRFRRGDPADELGQEIQTHLELEEEENRALGMPPNEARYAARRAFGNVALVKEDSRDMWLYRSIGDFLKDLRFGLRTLSRNPSFAAVAALTLALGIGANTAIFGFADLIIRRPVALPEVDRLAAVSEYIPGTEENGVSPANYIDLQAESRSFESLAAYQFWSAAMTDQSEPEEVGGVRVTPNFFSTLDLQPALGRTFLPDEAERGKEHVLVISDGFWKRQFGGDSEVLGKTISLNQQSYTVIGVMLPKSTFPLGAPSFWTPLAFASQEKSERSDLSLRAVGRLAPGVSLEQARAEIQTRWVQMGKLFPETNMGRSVRVAHLLDDIVLDYNRQFALLLLGVVGFVLLIACANVANLQLARAAGRQREIAIRASVGAGRGRILAQLVTESILLATIGAIVGLFLAIWGVRVLRATLPSEVQKFCDLSDLRVDSTGLLFTLLVTVLAGLLAGIVPAWQQTRSDLHGALKEGGGRIAGTPGHRLQRTLVVGEIALALVLLIGAGLMVKGFAALLGANPSLAPDSLLTLHIKLPQSRYSELYQAKAFSDQLLFRLQSLPDVESAALASGVPYSFYDDNLAIRIEGRPERTSGQLPNVMPESVSPAYFRSLHIPLREGREFETGDTAGAAPVAIVSESMALRFWPGESPIGKTLMLGTANADRPGLTVVGVVGDVLHEVYDRSFRSILYQPYQQAPPRSLDFVIRTKTNSRMQLLATVRSQVQEIDPNLPIEHLETMAQKMDNQTSGLRYVARLMAIFGAVALILSAVGVYGVMAYSVNERRREIGIRMALGAQSRDVLTLVIRSGFSLTLFGLVIGVALALALTHLVASLIYGVSSWDGTAFFGVSALLAAIALTASYIPARRATNVDPNTALRYD